MSAAAALAGADLRAYARQRFLLAMLVIVPLFSISLMFVATPDGLVPVVLHEAGRVTIASIRMPTLHGAIMVPITVGFLSGLVGLFLMLRSREADARLLACGAGVTNVLVARAAVLLAAVAVITAAGVAAALPLHRPDDLAGFVVANLLTGLEYGLLGVVAGTALDRIGGLYLMFFLPMIDIGLIQNPMLPRVGMDWWVRLLPGFPVTDLSLDAAFTPSIDLWGHVAAALAWSAALDVLATVVLIRSARAGR